jgi:DNA-binding Lrp family transcriptional regulator
MVAWVLVQTEVGAVGRVAEAIRKVKGVKSAEEVAGPYDVVVRAEASDLDLLGRLVVREIQGIEGETRTLTCPIIHL